MVGTLEISDVSLSGTNQEQKHRAGCAGRLTTLDSL